MKCLLNYLWVLVLLFPAGIYAQPVISSLSSASALPGASITITGSGYNSTATNNIVYFGGAKAMVTAASGTSLTVTVPGGATNSPISVYNTATQLTGYSSVPFHPTFITAPYILDSIHLAAATVIMSDGTGSKPSLVDLDLDGKTDFMQSTGIRCGHHPLVLFRNTGSQGNVTFSSTTADLPPMAVGPRSTVMSDIDGDGRPDLILGDYGVLGLVSVCRNTTSGASVSFASRVDYEIPADGRSWPDVVAGDVDGDGKNDIVFITAMSPNAFVLRNTATPGSITSSSLAAPVGFAVEAVPTRVLLEDIDGDGKRDIVTANSTGNSISILRNTSTPGSISFATAVNFVNPIPFAYERNLAIGDLNGDGKPDICVTNYLHQSLHIYENTSTPGTINSSSLSGPVSLITSETPVSVAIGDLNSDGKPDIIVGHFGAPTLSIYRGISGSGTLSASSFAPRQDFAASPWLSSLFNLEICDLDNDGKPDVIAANACSGTWSVLRNDPVSAMQITGTVNVCNLGGTGTLTGTPAGGTWSSSQPTIATVGSTGLVTGMSGSGTATITYSLLGLYATKVVTVNPPASTTITGNGSICAGLTATFTNTTANGAWSSSNPAIATVSPSGIVTGITPGSAIISYATGCGAAAVKTANIRLIPGPITGTPAVSVGTTTALSAMPTGGTWISGNPALATVGSNTGIVMGIADGQDPITYKMTSTGCLTSVSVRVNTGNVPPKVNSISSPIASSGSTVNIAGTNFNGTASNNIVYFGATKATVNTASPTSLNVTVPPGAIYAPVSVLNTGVSLQGSSPAQFMPVYDNANNIPGSFFFLTVGDLPSGTNPTSSAICDIDGDGKPDLISANSSSNTISVFRNVSTAGTLNANSFAAKVDFATGTKPVFVTTADVNEDGKPDVIVVNSVSATVSVFKNTATPGSISGSSLAAKIDYATAALPVSLAIADIDGNGKPDIAVCNQHGVVSLLRNNVSSAAFNAYSFGPKVDLTSACNVAAVAFGDVDGDKKPDMVVTGTTGTNKVFVYRNAGSTSGTIDSTSFDAPVAIATDTAANVVVSDLDGDGKQDIVCQGINKFFILRNQHSGGAITASSFASEVVFSHGEYSNPGGLAVADIDGDGKPDVAMVSNGVSLYRNISSGGISSSSFIYQNNFGPGALSGVAIGDLDGDGKPDMAMESAYGTVLNLYRNISEITGPQFMCTGNTYTLSGGVAGGAWSSSAPAVATIEAATGVANAISAGNVTLTYTWTGGSVIAPLTVNASPAPITGSSSVCKGTTATFSIATTGGNWISSNHSVAQFYYDTIHVAGVAMGLAAGTTTIRYGLSNGCSSTATLTVNPFGAGTISGPSAVNIGQTTTMTSTESGGTWSTSNSKASVSAGGVVTGLAEGNTTISYQVTTMCGTSIATYPLFVALDIAPLTGTFSVCPDSTVTLTSATTGGVWSTTNSFIATVTPGGLLTGVNTGTVEIRYTVSSTTITQVVTVNPIVSVDLISGTNSINVGDSSQMNNSTAGGTWSSSDPTIASVSATGLVTGVSAGIAYISYTKTNSCSSASTNVPVIISNPGGLEGISGISTICSGTTTTLSNSTTGGSWSSSNAAIATIGSSTGIVNALSAGITTISYTYMGSSVTKIVTVLAIPAPAAIGGTGVTCVGNTTTLTNAVSGGIWSVGSSMAAYISPAGVVSGLVAGTSVITYSVTNPCGSAAVTKTVTVNSAPATGTITGEGSVCAGSAIILSSTVPGGTWTSSNATLATVSVSTGEVSGIAVGTVNISYTVTVSGCVNGATTVVMIDIPTSPLPITGGGTMCAGATTTLSCLTSGGTWSSGNASVAAAGSTGVISGVSAGTAVISYITTNSCGATSATKVVTVTTAGSAGTISGPSHVTAGSQVTLSSSVSGGNWNGSNAYANVSGSGVVFGLASGTVNVTYTVSNSCGTIATTTVVTVDPAVSAITGTMSLCSGATTTLACITPGGTWSSNNTSIATINAGGVVSGLSPGICNITYTTTDGYATASVTVNAQPATITGTTTVCQGNTTVLSTTTTGGAWSISDAGIAGINSAGIVTGVSVGATTVSYVSGPGCLRTTTVTVTASPTIAGTPAVCPGTTVMLTPSVSGGSWTGGSTTIATIGSTGVLTGIAAGTVNISYNMGSGCGAVVTATVSTMPGTTGTMKVCTGTNTTLSNATSGGTWSSGDLSLATVTAGGVVTGVSPGTVTISYTAGTGCVRTSIVTVNPAPEAIVGTTVLCPGSSATLTDATPGLSWTSSNTSIASISSGGVLNGIAAGTATITYTAAGTNCITTTIVTVNSVPASITGSATGCAGSTIILSNAVPGGVWSSSNAAIATVDVASGVVTCLVPGMATITYTTGGGCYKTMAISISNSPTVTGYPVACVGLTTTLSGGSSGTWSSGNPAIAAITTSGGYVTGVSAGTASVTFTSTTTTCPATYVVTVVPVPAAITGPIQACSGQTATLSNSSAGGTWSSANTAVATVGSATGIVSAVGGSGNVTITYSFGNSCVTTVSFKVKPIPAVISGTYSVCATLATTLSDVTSGCTWSSSNTAVATVGTGASAGYGVVTGISAGTATISYTITLTGCARTAVVTVDPCGRPGGSLQPAVGSLQLYPNPTTGAFTVVTGEAGVLKVFAVDGREVSSYVVAKGVNELALPGKLAAAIYMCRYTSQSGETTIARLVVE